MILLQAAAGASLAKFGACIGAGIAAIGMGSGYKRRDRRKRGGSDDGAGCKGLELHGNTPREMTEK